MEWNRWRERNKPDEVDLGGADLGGANLGGANLRAAYLGGAYLRGAYLGRANLRGANLRAAYLGGANLDQADLVQANLSEANLRAAYLNGADLDGANLRAADLGGANLRATDLGRANLRAANLRRANLSEANLRRANLRRANLGGANLRAANLHRANLAEANLGNTVFANVDLREVSGLDSCYHRGPSTIDSRTLQYGPLPLVFLQGCGLSDWEIAAAKLHQSSLSPNEITIIGRELIQIRQGQPALQYHSCFISYSTGDEQLATQLHKDLQKNGVRCWFAPEDLKIGEKFRARIDEAIYVHERLLLILSERSIESDWVEKEVVAAFAKEQEEKRLALFPIRVDDAVRQRKTGWAADIRRDRHMGDFTNWKDKAAYQRGFKRLLRDLRAEDEREAQGAS